MTGCGTSETVSVPQVTNAHTVDGVQTAAAHTEEEHTIVSTEIPVTESRTPSQVYADILRSEWDATDVGCLFDIDADGIMELIMLATDAMNFRMYDWGLDQQVKECYFGKYTAVSSEKLFCAEDDVRARYFYWRCNYEYLSIQGYYDPAANNEIDIGVNYCEQGNGWIADWKLWNNDLEYDNGSEAVDNFYAATPVCYQVLLHMFEDCGFNLDDDSKYSQIPILSRDELIQRLQS